MSFSPGCAAYLLFDLEKKPFLYLGSTPKTLGKVIPKAPSVLTRLYYNTSRKLW